MDNLIKRNQFKSKHGGTPHVEQTEPAAAPIDIDNVIDQIVRYLKNHVSPEDLTEDEQRIMHTFLGQNWMTAWRDLA